MVLPASQLLFRELHATPGGKGFHFYCDTQQLCDDYALLSRHQLEFRQLPIPYPRANPNPLSLEKWSAGPAIKLVYLGGARMEKGFHLLASAEKILRNKYGGKLLWRLQAPVGGLEEPEVIAARRQLLSVVMAAWNWWSTISILRIFKACCFRPISCFCLIFPNSIGLAVRGF